jgi:hypothetical protein
MLLMVYCQLKNFMYVTVQAVDHIQHNVGVNSTIVSCEVLKEMLLKIQVFWDIMLCQLADGFQCFGELPLIVNR